MTDGTADGGPVGAVEFRRALGRFATGVTVVTVARPEVHAMTASAFTSVSLDPPLVAVCVDESAVLAGLVAVGEPMGVSVLAADQVHLSVRFASPTRPMGPAQLDGVAWTPDPGTGVALLDGAVATLAGPVAAVQPGGDHHIVLMEVHATAADPVLEPLVYLDGRYRRLLPPEEQGSEPG